MALTADFAAVLARLAESGAPLDRVGDWYEAHGGAFRSGTAADARLRTAVQDALAVCWSRRHRHRTDAVARRELRAIAQRLIAENSDGTTNAG
jgi:hypothetical protein